MSRTRRTAQEMLEEQEAKVAKLKERAALEAAKESPELAPLVEAIQTESSAIIEAQRGLGSGPQSFHRRAQKHAAWLDEINAAEVLASLILESATDRKDFLAEVLNELSSKVSQEMDVSVEVLEALASIPVCEGLVDAKIKYDLAHNARKSLSTPKAKESSNA